MPFPASLEDTCLFVFVDVDPVSLSVQFDQYKTEQNVAQYQESTQKQIGATTQHSVDIEAGNSKLFQHHFTRQLRIEPGRKH
jgi:hypothetical protein